jgi:hypothetical protein
MVRILIYRALELLQKLINVQKITLCSQVRERQRVGMHGRRMGRMCDHCSAAAIVGHGTLVTTSNDRERYTLKSHEPLANIVVGGRIDSASLGVAKELVQRIVSSTLSDFVGVVIQLLGLVYRVVDRTIRRVLRRAAVESGRSATWVLLAVACIGAHGPITRIVSTRCSGKRLQVSDYCVAQVRIERK